MRKVPDEIRRARGTDRPSRANHALEAEGASILPPDYLSEGGLRVWRTKVPGLVEKGLLTSLDRENFATWCELQAAIERGFREGKLPSRDLLQHYRLLSSAFGLNPDARGKLGMAPERPKDQEENVFDVWQRESEQHEREARARVDAYRRDNGLPPLQR